MHCTAMLLKKIIRLRKVKYMWSGSNQYFLCFIILVPRASCSLSRRGLSTNTGPCAQALPVKETGDAGNENGALLASTYDCDVGTLY